MIAVIFAVSMPDENRREYLDLAAGLRPLLAEVDGFISVERFQSLTSPDKLLSLSFWRDEAAVARWRTLTEHRKAQVAGRDHVFSGYRLRIAGVLRDYGMDRREDAPSDSRGYHTETTDV